MIESGHDPGDRFTLEAVRLYLSRTRPDGLVALHISNREHWLEPVVVRIARELKLAAQVWHDDREGRPGTRASSRVIPEASTPRTTYKPVARHRPERRPRAGG